MNIHIVQNPQVNQARGLYKSTQIRYSLASINEVFGSPKKEKKFLEVPTWWGLFQFAQLGYGN